MSDESTEEYVEVDASSGGGSKLVLILTGVNILITGGILALVLMNHKKNQIHPQVDDITLEEGSAHEGEEGDKKKEKAEGAEPEKAGIKFGKMINLERFTVNLAASSSINPKYVRVNISLEVPNEDIEGEVTQKMPQVRNSIIDLFNSKKAGDLATGEGREYLKEEIKNALNSFLVTGKVSGVFFTNFAVTS